MILLSVLFFSCGGSGVKSSYVPYDSHNRSRKTSGTLSIAFFRMVATIVKIKLDTSLSNRLFSIAASLVSLWLYQSLSFFFSDCRVWRNHGMEGRVQWSPVKINSSDHTASALRTFLQKWSVTSVVSKLSCWRNIEHFSYGFFRGIGTRLKVCEGIWADFIARCKTSPFNW